MFHVCHFLLLSDEALQVLGEMFMAMESAGLIPRQASGVVVVLIVKATGGFTTGSGQRFARMWRQIG